jgi:hypothetical protein
MKIQFQNFQGMRPRTSPDKLPDNYAQVATDCDFRGGVLAPAQVPASIKTLSKPGTLRTLYKHGARFLAFEGDVDVIESPIYDADGRFAWTDGTTPKQSNDTLAFSGAESGWPTATRTLGVPYPESPLTIALSGTASDEVRWSGTYCYTYVTAWGEESANSYPTGVTDVYEGQTITLTGFTVPTVSGLVVDKFRIYRAEATSSGSAVYELVAEVEETTTSWDDTVTDLSDDTLDTETWIPAPDDMKGLVLTSGGMAVGFSGKELYVSEPFVMYAYPEGYRQVVDADVVGLGFSNSTVFVLTEEHPWIMSGVSPESMTLQRVNFPQACVSKKSIINLPGGCAYASPDGLVQIDATGNCTVLTGQVYTKEQWAALNPETIIGVYFDRKYYGFFSGGTTGFVFDAAAGAVRTLTIGRPVYDAIYDSVDNALYLLVYDSGYRVLSLGAGDDAAFTYKTRQVRVPAATNMACGRVFGDQDEESPVTLKMYCDGTLMHTATVSNTAPFRLPGGFRSQLFEVQAEGSAAVTLIELATSISELIA